MSCMLIISESPPESLASNATAGTESAITESQCAMDIRVVDLTSTPKRGIFHRSWLHFWKLVPWESKILPAHQPAHALLFPTRPGGKVGAFRGFANNSPLFGLMVLLSPTPQVQ